MGRMNPTLGARMTLEGAFRMLQILNPVKANVCHRNWPTSMRRQLYSKTSWPHSLREIEADTTVSMLAFARTFATAVATLAGPSHHLHRGILDGRMPSVKLTVTFISC